MDSSELIELFYNRTYEKFVNKQILDDKNYIVPRQQLKNYVNELVNIPYIDFINYIKLNGIERKIEASDITQFTSFSACEIEMCNALIWANNSGCQYVDIGRFFPNNTIGRSDGAYRRYGESHIKAATQLGLTFEYYNYWYLSCLGYIYPNLDEYTRKRLLARTITRNRLYQLMLIDILDHDIEPVLYISISSGSTLRRGVHSVCRFFNICLEECKKQGIRTYQIKGRIINNRKIFNSSTLDDNAPEQSIYFESFLKEIRRYPLCSVDEEIESFIRYERGDKNACNELIKSNLRFVVSVAETYRNQGLDLQDLIQEGTIGLINAVEHFDCTRGIPFIKYAIWWIRQSIVKALITQPYIVQIPLSTMVLHRRARDFIDSFEQKQGYLPSVDDIEVNESSDLESLNHVCQLPADLKEVTCLVGDFDVFESSDVPTDYFQEAEYNSYYINRQLRHLGYRNCTILRKYFGINQEEETLDAIGGHFGLTRERTRQIVEKSIKCLREINTYNREKNDYVIHNVDNCSNCKSKTLRIDYLKVSNILKELNEITKTPSRVLTVSIKIENQIQESFIIDQKKDNCSSLYDEMPECDNFYNVTQLNNNKEDDNEQTNKKEVEESEIEKIEYANDEDIENDRSQYVIANDELSVLIPPFSHEEKRHKENKKEKIHHNIWNEKEAMVGNHIIYDSIPCLVIGKKTDRDSFRLIVQYEDGTIDNLHNDCKRYRVVDSIPCDVEIATLQEKNKEQLFKYYTQLIMKLNQAIVHGKKILAKPALLVAVIDDISSREILQNRILITTSLKDKYNRVLAKYTGKTSFDRLTSIAMPFWHLQSDKFWFLEPSYPNAKNFSPTKKWLLDNIKYARLDDDLWYLLQDKVWRNKLRNFIIEHKLLDNSTSQKMTVQKEKTDKHPRSEKRSQPKFLINTSLNELVKYGIITNRQLKHCYKKGLRTIGDVKKKIEYYHLTPDSTRFTKYTINMWFGIVGLLNNNI